MRNNWKKLKVKDFCEIGRGRVISAEEIRNNLGIYPVFSSQTANDGEMGKINSYNFDGEYVTWTTDGAYAGTIFYRNGKFNCTNVCGTLKPKFDNFSAKFLAYKLSTVAKDYVSYVGNPKLMNNVMAEIEIEIPLDFKEQTAIAEILGNIDSAIEKTQKLIETQKRIKQGLMQDLLTKGIDEHGNIRNEKTHRFKDSPLGRIPEEWDVWNFENLIDSAVDGPFGSNLKTSHYVNENGVRVVRLQNIGSGVFIDIDKAYVSRNHAETLIRHQVVSGDLIVASMGDDARPIARACLYPANFESGIVKADCFRIRLKKNLAVNAYAKYVLNCPSTREDLELLSQGVTRERVNLTKLKEIRMRKPPLDEQKKIVNILDLSSEEIIKEEAKLEKLILTKNGLIQDLLTGKKSVENLISE